MLNVAVVRFARLQEAFHLEDRILTATLLAILLLAMIVPTMNVGVGELSSTAS